MSGRSAIKLLPLTVLLPVAVAAQSVASRGGIPAIAKAASGSVVSIVMSDKAGRPVSQGSGFLVSTDGLIVTNYHVISEGSSAVAKLPNGALYVVDGVLTFDRARDVAVVKAHGQNFRKLTLGNSDHVQVGEEVVAIGNPLSLDSTVSNGIVSGMRTFKEERKLLQITAPISIGSSGGPVFDMAGGVIGITTMFLKDGENLNFAIPINDAKPLLVVAPLRLKAFPDEANRDREDSSASSSAVESQGMPELKATIDFLTRMVEPERREIREGTLPGAGLHSTNGPSLTMISRKFMAMAYTTGATYAKGYPEFTYSVVFESGRKLEQKDYPRYLSFALGDIDSASIETQEGGYDPYALAEFWGKHPKCEESPECAQEYLAFLESAPKVAQVRFHTTGRNPLIEQGGCPQASACAPGETTGDALILFKDRERAGRFVTALTYAVKLLGQQSNLSSARQSGNH